MFRVSIDVGRGESARRVVIYYGDSETEAKRVSNHAIRNAHMSKGIVRDKFGMSDISVAWERIDY